MTGLILSKKTGFKNNSLSIPVIIRDFRGKMFYSTEGMSHVKSFNMPEGQYFIQSGNITALHSAIKYKLIKLPKPERQLQPPIDFLIEFGENPNKCTISWVDKRIFFDNALLAKTLPELYFILYHEFGHSLYGIEKWADAMSANIMLSKGYNPSQIGKAPITSLSSFQSERKKHIVSKLLKHAKQY